MAFQIKQFGLDIKKTILKKYPDLTKKQKKIADYIVQNNQRILGISGRELSKNTEVSEASIGRFAKALGFEGFYQLRSQMVMEAREILIPEDRFKLLSHGKNQISTLYKVAEQDVDNINKTINQIERTQFINFIGLLRSARHIYTFGIGISSLMARMAAYYFNQAGVRANFCSKDEHAFIEKLILLGKKDLVFSLSYPPYSKETVDTMKFCFKRNVTCLAITDKPTSPITRWCHAFLVVNSHNLLFSNSASAVSMVLYAVATELAFLNKNKAVKNSKLITQILGDEFYSD
jgi:DNA-binding MurR/RpiR family transcriptional regulator